jgi:hypothetical protein
MVANGELKRIRNEAAMVLRHLLSICLERLRRTRITCKNIGSLFSYSNSELSEYDLNISVKNRKVGNTMQGYVESQPGRRQSTSTPL